MKSNFTTLSGLGLLLIMILLSACSSTQRAINYGNYDHAIDVLVKKLSKKRKKQSRILELEEAYAKANARDLKRIDFLITDNDPAKYYEIYDLYARLDHRAEKVSRILPLYVKKELRYAEFEINSYHSEIVNYRDQAADFLYAEANKLLSTDNKQDARKAYEYLNKLRLLKPNYDGIASLLDAAAYHGKSNVLFRMVNKSGVVLPEEFDEAIVQLGINSLDQQWIDFHNQLYDDIDYDYEIVLEIGDFDVSPEKFFEKVQTFDKEIKNGWEYVLDENGNVAKDTLGNDIKQDVFKTIYCDLVETNQNKSAYINGQMKFFDFDSHHMLRNQAVNIETTFANSFFKAFGDTRALEPGWKAKIKESGEAVPFPTDFEMLMQAAQDLKPRVFDILDSNDHLVLN